jgi:hypothetical protein
MNMAGLARHDERPDEKEERADVGPAFRHRQSTGVQIKVCEMSMDLMGFKREEIIDYPNIDFCGVATFWRREIPASNCSSNEGENHVGHRDRQSFGPQGLPCPMPVVKMSQRSFGADWGSDRSAHHRSGFVVGLSGMGVHGGQEVLTTEQNNGMIKIFVKRSSKRRFDHGGQNLLFIMVPMVYLPSPGAPSGSVESREQHAPAEADAHFENLPG